MVFNYLEDGVSYIFALAPHLFEPFLKLLNIMVNLNVQLNILGKACFCKIAGSNQSIPCRDIHRLDKLILIFVAKICNVCFCVEFAFVKYSALNFSRLQSIQNRGHTRQELILLALSVNTIMQTRQNGTHSSVDNVLSSFRNFISQNNPDFIEFLPVCV